MGPLTDRHRAETRQWLRDRWAVLLPDRPDVGDRIIAGYADESRIYHDLRHLVSVLEALDLLTTSFPPRAVELAAWFHDAVYDVGRADNEDASARLAESLLTGVLDSTTVPEVVRLVLLTRDHAVAEGDGNGALLCDADLAVLAAGPEDYADYTDRVRREYATVDDDAFRAGRAQVLRSLLALPALFHTPYGLEHWEGLARANLQSELSTLTTG